MEHHTTNPNKETEQHDTAPVEEKVTTDLVAAGATKFKHKKLIICLVVLIVVLGSLFALGIKYKGLVIAAMVDNTPISRFKVIEQLERQSGKEALDFLVNRQLIKNEAKRKNITVSESEIDEVLKKYEDAYAGQGAGSFDDLIAAQGLTREDLREEILVQKQAEKLLADKTQVTDEEVQKFITDNQVVIEAGKEQEMKDQIREQVKQSKIEEASSAYLAELREKAKIKTFVEYK